MHLRRCKRIPHHGSLRRLTCGDVVPSHEPDRQTCPLATHPPLQGRLSGFGSPTPQPGTSTGDWAACDQWHRFAINRIKRIDPALLIVSQIAKYGQPHAGHYTPMQWDQGLQQLLAMLRTPNTAQVVIGIPVVPQYDGLQCLSRHIDDIQACSGPPDPGYTRFNRAEQLAAEAEGARFINVVPWFCAKTCSLVIGHYDVYLTRDHVSAAYSLFLTGALDNALDLSRLQGRR